MTAGLEPSLQRIESALLLISRSSSTRRAHGRWAREAGIDIAHVPFRILTEVCKNGPVRSADLARALDMEAPLVSRELKVLEEQGLVSRRADRSDRRAHLVQATAAGRRLYAKFRLTLDQRIHASVRTWTPSELDQFARLLERFAFDVSTPAADPPSAKRT